MRKLLLATIAAVGVAGAAQAQTKMVMDTGDAAVPAVTPAPGALTGAAPAPGQIVVRLNGVLRAYYTFASQPGVGAEGGKVASTHSNTYIRLYPGFDAQAANGLKYGVAGEIREDNATAASASPTSTTASRNSLYWRRAEGYVGSDTMGRLVVGMGDGPFSRMSVGWMGELGDGNFCGDTWGSTAGIPGIASAPNIMCSGSFYSTNKIQYYSPQFMGFDFGIAYEPNTGTGGMVSGCTNSTATGCNSQTVSNSELTRRRDLVDLAVRYRGTFNGVGVAASGGYLFSGKMAQSGGGDTGYDGLSIGHGGLTVSYMGFSLQGAVQGGVTNAGALNLDDAPNQLTWQVGGSYTSGPLQVGVSYFQTKRAGSWASDGDAKRTDRGVYSAVNYGLAPGLSAMLIYAWGESEQDGKDVNSWKSGTQNQWDAHMLTAGLAFRW